jgi:type 1 glutamine amidotransferase
MVLKGGNGIAKRDMPQKVEARAGFAAKQLHFLGNVGGWAHPLGGGNVPVLKVTVHYAGGKTEELLFKNGEDFADYIREIEVPGSRLVQGIARDGKQVRFATRKLTGDGVIEKLTFESFNNGVAPTTLAVTADLSADSLPAASQTATGGTPAPAGGQNPGKGKGKNAAKVASPPVQVASAAGGTPQAAAAGGASVPASQSPMTWGAGTKVLLVGGGSSHDYKKWFGEADTALLKAAGCSVNYTEDGDVTARELTRVDVAVLSVNAKEWATPALREALFKFADSGKGLVLLHPGLWYNFADWPDYNKVLAGGGSRGHDRLGEFEVKVTNASHPLMKGVSASFKITDELYYFEPDAQGSAIEVFATATSQQRNKTYPQVFIVKHPKTRIAAITLGHDGRAHDLPEFQALLKNAVNWGAGK